ncbi:hypothetical protein JOQ06_012173, partial [Pogonophryne albipinna]
METKCRKRGKDIKAFDSEDYLTEQKDQIRLITQLVLTAGFVAIVIAACVLNFNRALVLLVISLVTVFFLVWDWMMECYGNREELSPIRDLLSRNWFWIRWNNNVLTLKKMHCLLNQQENYVHRKGRMKESVEATHLLSASVMSAPASLAIAKTFWPEIETQRVTAGQNLKVEH